MMKRSDRCQTIERLEICGMLLPQGQYFQHKIRFSGQQGPESLILGAKDVPNADSGQQGLESLIIGAKDIPNADSRRMMRFIWPAGAGEPDHRKSRAMRRRGRALSGAFRCDRKDVTNANSTGAGEFDRGS